MMMYVLDSNDEQQLKDTIASRKQWSASHQLCHDAANGPFIHCTLTQSVTR